MRDSIGPRRRRTTVTQITPTFAQLRQLGDGKSRHRSTSSGESVTLWVQSVRSFQFLLSMCATALARRLLPLRLSWCAPVFQAGIQTAIHIRMGPSCHNKDQISALPNVEANEPGEGDLPEPLRKMFVENQVGASIIHAKEFFEHELNLRERFDAMIVRQVKHLIQTKSMKQMRRQTSAARDDEQLKRITARNGLQ